MSDPKVDPDNPEWTEGDFLRARPTAEVLGDEVASLLTRKTVLQLAFKRATPWLTIEKLAA